MKTVLILGAGFSKSILPKLPLEHEALALGMERLDHEDNKCIPKLDSKFKAFYPDSKLADFTIEEILSKIDIELYILNNRLDRSSTDYNNDLRTKYYNLLHIRDSLLLIYFKSIEYQLDNNKLIARFFNEIESSLTIITFNQDFILEEYCTNHKLDWNYGIPIITKSRAKKKNGFYFELYHPESTLSPYALSQLRKRIPYYSNIDPTFELLKLHGSFNWFYCPICNNFIGRPFNQAGISGRPYSSKYENQDWPLCTNMECIKILNGQPLYMPLIMPPTYLKTYTISFLPDLWYKANKAILKAERIIVFGYSFREEDALSINMFYNLKDKNPSLSSIEVIDIAFQTNSDFKRRIENITKVKCADYKSIEDFINKKLV
jgi:hypothetical protein